MCSFRRANMVPTLRPGAVIVVIALCLSMCSSRESPSQLPTDADNRAEQVKTRPTDASELAQYDLETRAEVCQAEVRELDLPSQDQSTKPDCSKPCLGEGSCQGNQRENAPCLQNLCVFDEPCSEVDPGLAYQCWEVTVEPPECCEHSGQCTPLDLCGCEQHCWNHTCTPVFPCECCQPSLKVLYGHPDVPSSMETDSTFLVNEFGIGDVSEHNTGTCGSDAIWFEYPTGYIPPLDAAVLGFGVNIDTVLPFPCALSFSYSAVLEEGETEYILDDLFQLVVSIDYGPEVVLLLEHTGEENCADHVLDLSHYHGRTLSSIYWSAQFGGANPGSPGITLNRISLWQYCDGCAEDEDCPADKSTLGQCVKFPNAWALPGVCL